MKDLSLFLLKNSLSLKLKKGIRNFCNGAASTTTADPAPEPMPDLAEPPVTLEQMIRRLEMEEAAARRAKVEEDPRRRMSAVNSSDILRSARKALDQYPRFSVDGRDAMYRSSFVGGAATTASGKRVVWCEPGIVARLMGLEAVPVQVPVAARVTGVGAPARRRRSSAAARREKERLLMGLHRQWRPVQRRESVGSCSAAPPEDWPDWRRFAGFR